MTTEKTRAYQINVEDCFVTYLQRKFDMNPDSVDLHTVRRVCDAVTGSLTMDQIDDALTHRYVDLIPGDVNVQHFEMEGKTTIERIMEYAKHDDWIRLIAKDTAEQIRTAVGSIKAMPTTAYIFKDIGLVIPFLYCLGRLFNKEFTNMLPYEERSYRMRINWEPYMANESYHNFKRHFDTVFTIFNKEKVFFEFDHFINFTSRNYDWRNVTILISRNIDADNSGRFMLFPSVHNAPGNFNWREFCTEYENALEVYRYITSGHRMMLDFFIRYMEDRYWKYDSAKMLRYFTYATVDIFYYNYSDYAFDSIDPEDNETTIAEFESVIDELVSGLN